MDAPPVRKSSEYPENSVGVAATVGLITVAVLRAVPALASPYSGSQSAHAC